MIFGVPRAVAGTWSGGASTTPASGATSASSAWAAGAGRPRVVGTGASISAKKRCQPRDQLREGGPCCMQPSSVFSLLALAPVTLLGASSSQLTQGLRVPTKPTTRVSTGPPEVQSCPDTVPTPNSSFPFPTRARTLTGRKSVVVGMPVGPDDRRTRVVGVGTN